jgi:hypothetical protein
MGVCCQISLPGWSDGGATEVTMVAGILEEDKGVVLTILGVVMGKVGGVVFW